MLRTAGVVLILGGTLSGCVPAPDISHTDVARARGCRAVELRYEQATVGSQNLGPAREYVILPNGKKHYTLPGTVFAYFGRTYYCPGGAPR